MSAVVPSVLNLEDFEPAAAASSAQSQRCRESALREAAIAEGRAAGLEEGRAEARSAAEVEIAALTAKLEAAEAAAQGRETEIAAALAALAEAEVDAVAQRAAAVDKAVRIAARALAPLAAERGFADVVAARAREWAAAVGGSEAVLRLNPAAAAAHGAQIEAALGEGVRIETDATLGAGQARVSWARGFGEIDMAQATAALSEALEAAAEGADGAAPSADKKESGDELE